MLSTSSGCETYEHPINHKPAHTYNASIYTETILCNDNNIAHIAQGSLFFDSR